MIQIKDYPAVVLVVSLLAFWLSVQLGGLISKRATYEKGEREDLSLMTNASLTLLALIIGFSFSMALGRYDQRRNYEAEEANAIGTEYVRADLLPATDGARVRSLLNEYVDQRASFYSVRDMKRLELVRQETARLQKEMWSTVQNAARATPSIPMVLVISGMNDVLNSADYSQAAWWYRVPTGAWLTMVVLSVCCCVLIGFGAQTRGRLLLVFPFLVAVSFFFIADIDSPVRGIIRVPPKNLINLSQSMHQHE